MNLLTPPEDPKWKNGAVRMKQSDLTTSLKFTLITSFFAGSFRVGGPTSNKITTVYDYTAEAVAFTPKLGDMHFLFLQLNEPRSVSSTSSPTYTWYFGADFRPTPRTPFVLDEESGLYCTYYFGADLGDWATAAAWSTP